MALIKCPECGATMSDHAKMCPNCGFMNRTTFCPECDTPLNNKVNIWPNCGYACYQQTQNSHTEINALCVTGMILGFISFLIDFWGIISLTALVFSVIGLFKSQEISNSAMAIVGIIASSIELFFKIVMLLRWLFVISSIYL